MSLAVGATLGAHGGAERAHGPRPLGAARARYHVRRSALLFIPGMIAGYLWLSPVFVPPGGGSAPGLSIERFARVLSVALVLPFAIGRLVPMLAQQRVLLWALLAFVIAPIVTAANHPDVGFVVGVVGPYMAGGASLLCLAALRPESFLRWCQGVGVVATAFVAAGFVRYGFDAPSYYGRPRVHLGFVHPTQTASAVLVAGLYVAYTASILTRRRPAVRRAVVACSLAALAALLVVVSSRNTALLLGVILLGAGYARALRRPAPRVGLVLLVLSLFPAILLFATQVDRQRPLWVLVNFVSSYRLEFYSGAMARLAGDDWTSLLIGPTAPARGAGAGGFAVVDSVYLSIFFNYGLITLLAFYAFWIAVTRRVSRAGLPLEYGVLCAVSVYFLLDAQGATPSNLLVFVLVAWTVRAAIAAPRGTRRPARSARPARALGPPA